MCYTSVSTAMHESDNAARSCLDDDLVDRCTCMSAPCHKHAHFRGPLVPICTAPARDSWPRWYKGLSAYKDIEECYTCRRSKANVKFSHQRRQNRMERRSGRSSSHLLTFDHHCRRILSPESIFGARTGSSGLRSLSTVLETRITPTYICLISY